MDLPSFAVDAAQTRGRGFREVAERRRDAMAAVDTHPHPFAVRALVVQGGLTQGVPTRRRCAGDGLEPARVKPHAERHGVAATWAARRSSPRG